MALSFTDAFGKDAYLQRTNDPNNMFKVVATPAVRGPVKDWEGGTSQQVTTPEVSWNFDPKTNSFSLPGSDKTVSAADLGITGATGSAVPYMLAPLATAAGKNYDQWSNYALTHNNYGTPGTPAFNLAAAQDLQKAAPDIIGYENKGPQGINGIADKYGLAIVLSIAGAGFASAIGGVATAGETAATAASGGASSFETALANAGIGAAKNAAMQLVTTGKVNLGGVVGGAVGGGFSSYLPDVSNSIGNAAIKGAFNGGVGALASGGDVLKGALTGGATAAAGQAAVGMLPGGTSNTVKGGVSGLVKGGVGALINGQPVGTGIINGAITGTANGAARDLGANPTMAGLVGSTVGSALTHTDQTGNTIQNPTTIPKTTTSATSSTVPTFGFTTALPMEYHPVQRTDMNWGGRSAANT